MKKTSKTVLSFFVGILMVTAFAFPGKAEALLPFGGPILFVFPCINGLLVTVGPPVGGMFMYPWGALSYAYGPPAHPGQFLLGVWAGFMACLIPSPFGPIPVGGGSIILYHGSSI